MNYQKMLPHILVLMLTPISMSAQYRNRPNTNLPPYTLTDKDPLFLVEGKAILPHTVSINSVQRWLKEGRWISSDLPHQGTSVYQFNNGKRVGIYPNTPQKLVNKFRKLRATAPGPQIEVIE